MGDRWPALKKQEWGLKRFDGTNSYHSACPPLDSCTCSRQYLYVCLRLNVYLYGCYMLRFMQLSCVVENALLISV